MMNLKNLWFDSANRLTCYFLRIELRQHMHRTVSCAFRDNAEKADSGSPETKEDFFNYHVAL